MKTVLIIEDDTALRENISELLELSGYKTITAPEGKQGIELAIDKVPDLIICDIMMPLTDGYTVLETLSQNERTRQIPFIFLSAKTEHKEVRKGMNMGADDYLTKPFEEEELLSAIESRLAKAELLAQASGVREGESEEGIRNLHELKNFFDDQGKILRFDRGEKIYSSSDRANTVHLILKGVVKTYTLEESGKELTTTLYRADDFLGFSSFTENVTYRENAEAVEDCELAGISKTQLQELLEENKKLSLELMSSLTDDLRSVKEQLLQMAYGSVRKKTANTILQFAEVLNKKPNEAIKISRHDLASVAGIATESLIRCLSEFKKNGLIDISGRTIKVTDLKGLQEVN